MDIIRYESTKSAEDNWAISIIPFIGITNDYGEYKLVISWLLWAIMIRLK